MESWYICIEQSVFHVISDYSLHFEIFLIYQQNKNIWLYFKEIIRKSRRKKSTFAQNLYLHSTINGHDYWNPV